LSVGPGCVGGPQNGSCVARVANLAKNRNEFWAGRQNVGHAHVHLTNHGDYTLWCRGVTQRLQHRLANQLNVDARIFGALKQLGVLSHTVFGGIQFFDKLRAVKHFF
jgi:hypothetical protein